MKYRKNQNSIFVLRMYSSSEKIKYPVKLNCELLGYFTEIKKAEYFISFPIKSAYWFLEEYPFKIFEIQQYGLNYFLMDDYIRIYDCNGKFYGKHESKNWTETFYGREQKDCRFKIGDWVEFIQGSILNVGIVAELPPDKKRVKEICKRANKELGMKMAPLTGYHDDRYLVLTGYGRDEHSHPQIFNTFPPSGEISQRLKKHLEKRFQNVVDKIHQV